MALNLTSEGAYIFRITHRENVPWIVRNGLHCRNSDVDDANFVAIGNPELIDKRRTQMVPCPPGGYLSDYIPFYFTPHSVMLFQINTGYNGIRRRLDWEIWRRRDFRGDPEYIDKKDRYQAEALVYRHLPIDGILGIVCYSDDATRAMKARLGEAAEGVKIATKPSWYFR
jgi:hypothetical protein